MKTTVEPVAWVEPGHLREQQECATRAGYGMVVITNTAEAANKVPLYAIPEGWALVPERPTTDMLYAMAECDGHPPGGDRSMNQVPDWIAYDPQSSIITIRGKRYAASLFDDRGLSAMVGTLLRIERGPEDVVTCCTVPEGDALPPLEPAHETVEAGAQALAQWEGCAIGTGAAAAGTMLARTVFGAITKGAAARYESDLAEQAMAQIKQDEELMGRVWASLDDYKDGAAWGPYDMDVLADLRERLRPSR